MTCERPSGRLISFVEVGMLQQCLNFFEVFHSLAPINN